MLKLGSFRERWRAVFSRFESLVGPGPKEVYYQEITVSNFDSIKRLKEAHSFLRLLRVGRFQVGDFFVMRASTEDYAGIKKDENDDAKKMYDLEQRRWLTLLRVVIGLLLDSWRPGSKQLKEPMKKANQDLRQCDASATQVQSSFEVAKVSKVTICHMGGEDVERLEQEKEAYKEDLELRVDVCLVVMRRSLSECRIC